MKYMNYIELLKFKQFYVCNVNDEVIAYITRTLTHRVVICNCQNGRNKNITIKLKHSSGWNTNRS